jgi:hypothetical protein
MKNNNTQEVEINKIASQTLNLYHSYNGNNKNKIEFIEFIGLIIEIEPAIIENAISGIERAIICYYQEKVEDVSKLRIKKDYKQMIIDKLYRKMDCDIEQYYVLNTHGLRKHMQEANKAKKAA